MRLSAALLPAYSLRIPSLQLSWALQATSQSMQYRIGTIRSNLFRLVQVIGTN
jgi:hypothetical protein